VEITLKYKRVSVLIGTPGTDRVMITLEGPTPFPEMGYDGGANIEVRKGYGVEWCRAALGIEPDEIIDASAPAPPKPKGPSCKTCGDCKVVPDGLWGENAYCPDCTPKGGAT
jgi:hypothetical protein